MKVNTLAIIGVLIIGISIVAFFKIGEYKFVEKSKNLKCKYFKQDKNLEFNGPVVEVFRDKKNHNASILRVENSNGVVGINLDFDHSGLFDFLKIGDSLYKEFDSPEVRVYNSNGEKKFVLDYLCEE